MRLGNPWRGWGRADGSFRLASADFLASLVVFLVALPLCMGIAIASGVPPALGLITGIVGGLVVGFVAGSPLQVSGPAAGLAVVVWEIVQSQGLAALGVIVLMAGAIQVLAGALQIGRWFRAVSPAVVLGMLAAIGILIFSSQFHVMLDDRPKSSGLENLTTIPSALWNGIWPIDGSQHHWAALVGLTTMAALVLWNLFRPKRLRAVPGALVGVLAGSLLANLLALEIQFVAVPERLSESFLPVSFASLTEALGSTAIWGAALGMAAIASAESLLCAGAVDQMQDRYRTRYDMELAAQGLGNMICGFFGALPLTGVIVRSSANVDAGGRSRWPAILHGALLLLLVALLPSVLQRIPTAALAAILVYTGYKLADPVRLVAVRRQGRGEVAAFSVTVVGVVAIDLLSGIGLGLLVSLLALLYRTVWLEAEVLPHEPDGPRTLRLAGAASFITLPRLAHALEGLPDGLPVHIDTAELRYLDHACQALLDTWRERYEERGGQIEGRWDHLRAHERARRPERSTASSGSPPSSRAAAG
ncbi:MAG: SulP family inorganic anion transporter [Myxococcales bacterium]|nr:SulP family inorganic anion transporter [Myxococcales bacterium]